MVFIAPLTVVVGPFFVAVVAVGLGAAIAGITDTAKTETAITAASITDKNFFINNTSKYNFSI